MIDSQVSECRELYLIIWKWWVALTRVDLMQCEWVSYCIVSRENGRWNCGKWVQTTVLSRFLIKRWRDFYFTLFSRKYLLQHVFCTDVNDPVEKEKLITQKRKGIITDAKSEHAEGGWDVRQK